MVGPRRDDVYVVAVQNHHAYLGIGSRLVVANISDPLHPAALGESLPFPSDVVCLTISGPLAYVGIHRGLRVLLENERVRVWEIGLAPGETLPMHYHEIDYVVVSATGGPTVVEWEDGRREARTHEPGAVRWHVAPHAHRLTNTGTQTYINRMIELKR